MVGPGMKNYLFPGRFPEGEEDTDEDTSGVLPPVTEKPPELPPGFYPYNEADLDKEIRPGWVLRPKTVKVPMYVMTSDGVRVPMGERSIVALAPIKVDEDESERLALSKAKFDYQKAVDEVKKQRLLGQDAAALAKAQATALTSKRRLDLMEQDTASKIAERQAKAKASEDKAALEARKFESGIDPTSGMRWADIFKQRDMQNAIASQSTQTNAAQTQREQGLRAGFEQLGQASVEQEREARLKAAYGEVYGEGDEVPWWHNLPGGKQFAERGIRARTQNLMVPAGTPSAQWDPVTKSYRAIPFAAIPSKPVEPIPEWEAPFQGAMNPFQISQYNENRRLYNANATATAQALAAQRQAAEQESNANQAFLDWNRLARRSRTTPYQRFR